MPDFKDIGSLLKYIEKQANSALKQECAETAVRTMQENVVERVYDVYEPVKYQRKGAQGGLLDRDNVEVQVVSDNTISIENIRHEGERDVARIVETGQGYWPGAPSVLTDGRKFTEATREELRSTGKLKEAMRKGLKRGGLDVRG